MNTIGNLVTAVKRFVKNNSNAVDVFQGSSPDVDYDVFLTDAIIQAANNARVYAEQNASFGWLDTTVSAFILPGRGLNLSRQYDLEESSGLVFWFSPGVTSNVYTKFSPSGILRIALPSTHAAFTSHDYQELQSISFVGASPIPTGTYTVIELKESMLISGVLHYVYTLDYSVTAPDSTAWAGGIVTVGVLVFAPVIRFNAVFAVNYVDEQGGKFPLDLDTRQSQHIKNTQLVHRGLVKESNYNPGVKVLFDGTFLKLNCELDQPLQVELTGSRWMDSYTSVNDTDQLLQEGFEFMMWRTVLELNYIVQVFVPRTDGALSPPEKASNEAWFSLLTNDAFATTSYYHQ